jgi:ADP-ribose pyrophosphatase YjhB (NUDIX family)
MDRKVICKDVFGKEYSVDVNELEQRIGVYLIVIEDDKILLTHQWDGYSLVGGGVEKGETLEEAVSREAKEETGLNITPGKLIHYSTTFFKRNEKATPKQSFQFYFTHTKLSGDIHNSHITNSERTYTNDIPEWVDIEKVDTINFRHSTDLSTILNAYKDNS